MKSDTKKMKTIWYFVGLLLITMGGLVLIAGIYDFLNPQETKKVLAQLYPSLWWGMIMVAAGFIFLYTNKRATVSERQEK